jgi:hypothetical protein
MENAMHFPGSILTAIVGLLASMVAAQAFDDTKYPDLFGVWRRVNLRVGGQPSFDQTKPWGRGQQAPLTAEYQAIHEASLADQANGGQGGWQSGARCMPPGMPASMNVYGDIDSERMLIRVEMGSLPQARDGDQMLSRPRDRHRERG